jgi:leucine dehydrogenase
MSVFTNESFVDHEQIHFWNDQAAGLKAIAAIHRAKPSNAIGGCRMYPYASDDDALRDVLRLSRAMSYKCAMAGIRMGGGKCVILGDPAKHKTEALLRSMGRFIQSLGGQFFTGEDVGIGVHDVTIMRKETQYLVGREDADSSSVAALGVFEGLKATIDAATGSPNLQGKKVAIQGLGQVGFALAEHLHRAGALLFVSDTVEERTQRAHQQLGATVVSLREIASIECDAFSPNALGGIIDERSVEQLCCKVIAGAANNQLTTPSIAQRLKARGILYAPDYVINAGGVINNALTLSPHFSAEKVKADTVMIGNTLREVFSRAEKENITTDAAAALIAEERMAAY